MVSDHRPLWAEFDVSADDDWRFIMVSSKFIEWGNRLEKIVPDISNLVDNNYIFWKVIEMMKNNPDIEPSNPFHQFLAYTYSDSSLMGIRRQIDNRKDSDSLFNLLKNIDDDTRLLVIISKLE